MPKPPIARKLGEFCVGKCQCGAVYTSDPTGFNVGSAMVEALVYACNDNWELAWDLLPEDDYMIGRLENYDEMTHQIVEKRNLDGRTIKGVLFFVRLHKDIEELTAKMQAKQNGKQAPASAPSDIPEIEPERDPKRKKQKADKKRVKELAEAMEISALVDLAFDDSKTLRFLQRLLYDPNDTARWRTAHVIGQVCARLSTRHPGQASDLLHRLFEASSDSAATHWGLIETIGSIVAARSDIFGAFTRHLLRYIGDPVSRDQVLWSLGTIAKKRPDLIRALPFYQLFSYIDIPDPQTVGLAIRLMGRIHATEVQHSIDSRTRDERDVVIYEEGLPVQTTVAALAQEALALINKQEQ